MSELFDAVDALVASRSSLPSAEERKRLRTAHGLTLDEVAAALKVRRATVSGWESAKKPTEPRGPEREAYARLLKQLAALYPAPPEPTAPTLVTLVGAADSVRAQTVAEGPAAEAAVVPAAEDSRPPAPVSAAAPHPAPVTRTSAASRRPGTRKATPVGPSAGGADPRFENGPLAVVDVEDGQVLAYCTGGLVLDVPAKSIPALVDWTLR
ncbi:helix-turn-helix domain-containing protein, partial [Streptomyces sp. NPDC003688]